MRPYGENKKIRRNLPDNHPQKGWVNWWEVELGSIDKGRARQESKKIIREEIQNGNN